MGSIFDLPMNASFNYINVSEENTNYKSIDGILFSKDVTELIKAPRGMKKENYIIPDSVTSIKNRAFYYCDGFTGDLIIPDSVTTIETQAFCGCDGFTGDLIIPDSVTSIRSSVFYGCDGFTGNLIIGNGVTSIGDNAFENCDGFTGSLTIGNSVTRIEYDAFYNCSGFTDGVVIPSVTSRVDSEAFIKCTDLDYVLFTTETPITANAGLGEFDNNFLIANSGKVYVLTNEMAIAYNKTYHWIKENGGKGVFSALATTNFNEKVKSNSIYTDMGVTVCGLSMNGDKNIRAIASYQLEGSNNSSSYLDTSTPGKYIATYTLQLKNASGEFEDVTNSSGVLEQKTRTIEVVASDYIPSENVEWITNGADAIKTYTDDYGTFKYYKSSGDVYAKIIQCTPSGDKIKFPDTIDGLHVIHIENSNNNNNIFNLTNNTTITEIMLPINIETIGRRAFYSCQAIRNQLNLPQTLKYIGNEAFYNCNTIKGDLIIPNSVTTIEVNAFSSCKGIKRLTLSNSLTEIKSNTFQNCTNFAGTLIIPDSVTTIGTDAFENCSFEKIIIPKTLTSLSGNVFGANKRLTYIEVDDENSVYKDINGIVYTQTEDTIVAVPAGMSGDEYRILETVTKVDYGAFNGCAKFKGSLVLHEGITEIGNKGFYNCTGYRGGLILPDSLDIVGAYAFSHCSGFSGDLVIHNGITRVSNNAFEYLTGMKGTLTIESGLNTISNATFQYSLFTGPLIIPTNITSVGASAYSHCTGFTGDLVLHNGITNVGNNAFEYLDGMKGTLTIGTGLSGISNAVFQYSDFTGPLIIPTNITSIGASAYYQCTGFTGELVIHNGITNVGASAFAELRGMKGSLTIGTGLTSISNKTFRNSKFTGSLIIPDTITTIGNEAFGNCGFNGILKLSATLQSIGYDAFWECKDFSGDLIIPEGVTQIGSYAFYRCGFNGKLVIPSTLTIISPYTFEYNYKFTGNIIIPETVTEIGDRAFLEVNGVDYVLVSKNDIPTVLTTTRKSMPTNKVFALTQEIADKYNKVGYWPKENSGNGVYPVLQAIDEIEKVVYGTDFSDTGATVAGLVEDPNGLFRKTVKYTRYEDVAVASLDGLRFAENTAITTNTLTTNIPGTYTATYTLQMYNEASGDYYDINVSGDFYDASNGIPLEQVTREIEVLVEAPKVLDIEVISPDSGEYNRNTEVTFNVEWSTNVLVDEAPTLFIKFSGDGEIRTAKYVGSENNISTYTYKIKPHDYGWLILDGYKGGLVNDEIGQDWISSEVTFDDEIFALRTYGAVLTETINGVQTEVEYITIADAIEAASIINEIDEGTYSRIKVIASEELDETLIISGDKKIQIDLNGNKLYMEKDETTAISNNGILQITDSIGLGELSISGDNTIAIVNNTSGDVIIGEDDGTINRDLIQIISSNIGIQNINGGTIYYNDGEIKSLNNETIEEIINNSNRIITPAYTGVKLAEEDGYKNVYLELDSTAPVIGTAEATTIDDEITLTLKNITDNGGVGINGIYISSGDIAPTKESIWIPVSQSTNIETYTIDAPDGCVPYYIWVIDSAGNISDSIYLTPAQINTNIALCGEETIIELIYSGDYISKKYQLEDSINVIIIDDVKGIIKGLNQSTVTINLKIENKNGTITTVKKDIETLDIAPTIIKQPENLLLNQIEDVTLNTKIEGTNLNYEWYRKNISSGKSEKLSDISIYKTNIEGISNGVATQRVEVNMPLEGEISFDYFVSSEENNDILTVTVEDANGVSTIIETSGNLGWQTYTGTHIPIDGKAILTFTYTKNESVDMYYDYAAIRNLSYKYYEGDGEIYYSTYTTDTVNQKETVVAKDKNVETKATHGWVIDTEDGETIFKSDNYNVKNSYAAASIEFPAEEAARIKFDYRVRSEKNYDKLTIKVIGLTTKEIIISGNGSWEEFDEEIIPNEYGKIKITLLYTKDYSQNGDKDIGAIKNLVIDKRKVYENISTFNSDSIFKFVDTNWNMEEHKGANTDTVIVPKWYVNESLGTYRYYCVAKNNVGTATTKEVQIEQLDSTCMITEWTIPEDNTTITLPISNTTNVMVDWGDNSRVDRFTSTFPTHTYEKAGTYNITIKGSCYYWGYYYTDEVQEEGSYSDYYTYTEYLTGLKQWGELGAYRYGFSQCKNLKYVTNEIHENSFTNVSNMDNMFYNCSSLETLDLSNAILNNSSNLNRMSGTFENCDNLEYVLIGENLKFIQTINNSLKFKGFITTLSVDSTSSINWSPNSRMTLPGDSAIYVPDDISEKLYEEKWRSRY